MSLSTVTLSWDLTDLIQSGLAATLSITPTAQLSDTTDHVLIPPVARTYTFSGGTGSLAGIVANDNANILPHGTGYLISVTDSTGKVIVPQFQTQVLFANGAVQWLDALAVVPSVTTSYQYLPLPSGTPQAGQVPVATGTGEASAWGSAGGGGGVTSFNTRTGAVVPVSGDYSVAQVTGAAPLASPAFTGTPTAPVIVVNNPSSYANGTFVGIIASGQYSNFNLADNVYPLDGLGHYWAFSHRDDHTLLIFNYNGSIYTNVVTVHENGYVEILAGSLGIDTAGQGLRIGEGANAKQGTVALVGGSKVVSNTAVTANSRIQLTSQADGGTPGWLRVSARTAGTSFTITSSSATDTSTVAYFITEPA